MKIAPEANLQIAYDGPALKQGRMPMLALANGLRGQALLIKRVNYLLHGDSIKVQVEIDDSFEGGSLIVPVHILMDAIHVAESALTSGPVIALANLLAILGFFGVNPKSIYRVFKNLKGHRIEKAEDVPNDLNIDITINQFIEIYNDAQVQEHLRRTIDPLHEVGVEEFQTRRGGVVIDRVSKEELLAADKEEIDSLTKDEEVDLDIEKAAWRHDLAWHFSDGKSSFDAKIQDENFWKQVDQGEAFSGGDRLRVHLSTTARRTRSGHLKLERTIPRVIEVDHVRRRQRRLFDHEDGS